MGSGRLTQYLLQNLFVRAMITGDLYRIFLGLKLVVRVIFLFYLVLTGVMASSPSYSTTVNCERTNYGSDAYSSPEAFESWWPKNLGLDGDKFKEAGSGSKAMVYKNTGGEKNSGNQFTRTFRLLPNKVLIGLVKPFGNYASVGNIRYKCDINSNELRVKLAEGGAAPSAPSRRP